MTKVSISFFADKQIKKDLCDLANSQDTLFDSYSHACRECMKVGIERYKEMFKNENN